MNNNKEKINAEDLLSKTLAGELSKEIDKMIIEDLKEMATQMKIEDRDKFIDSILKGKK